MHRLHNKRGFTLVETLAAIIILVLLSGVVGVGVQTALKSYNTLTFASESDILSSTLYTALSDILRFSQWVPPEDEDSASDDTVHFTSSKKHGIVNGSLLVLQGKIAVDPENSANGGTNSEGGGAAGNPDESESYYYLINAGAYSNLRISDFKLEYKDGVFSGYYIIENKGGTLQKKVEFAFRSLNAKQ